jgi:hypothetical protein
VGLLDRLRGASPDAPWHPPALGTCECSEHVESLARLVIEASPPTSAEELMLADAASVTQATDHHLVSPATGQRRGPFHWLLGYGDAVRRLYDEDAPASLDDMLYIQPGIDNVMRLDRNTLAVGAPRMCPDGVLGALMTALQNPRVRRAD